MADITGSDLRRGLDAHEIRRFVQLLVDLRTGRVMGFEALARWLHPRGGLLTSDRFMRVAEGGTLIGPLTEQIISQACSAVAFWPRDLLLSVNIAPLQLTERLLPNRLAALAAAAGFPPDRLIIEITETGIIANYEQTRGLRGSQAPRGPDRARRFRKPAVPV
jgi:EAL domain-containing protein (putative c-di-GMP-specific phosphodiesterase class I)